jgi:predicted alpha-1,6-mannanase (GH76 family)
MRFLCPIRLRSCASLALLVAVSSAIIPSDAAEQAASATIHPDYSKQATLGVQTLQGWYIEKTGLYQKPTDWWNAANAMTVLVDYARVSHTTTYLPAVENTFRNANTAYHTTNFVNDANDDEGWWAEAWIDAYDLTGKAAYLTIAETIFADMTTQWDTTTCGGGVWWSKNLKTSAYKNAITNELFLEIAASLANRITEPGKKAGYLTWAEREWKWFHASGMINGENLVNDGLNAKNPQACVSNKQTTWTYNQGVILGGLVELNRANHDAALLSKAAAIAGATTRHLVTGNGILKEPLGHGPDVPQFKGVFLRNLAVLEKAAPQPSYKAFILANADSILKNDQGANHQFGLLWEGPFDQADGTRQTSALDAIVAAAAMQ